MGITEKQLKHHVEYFVELFNQGQLVAACYYLYAKNALVAYETTTVVGVDNICNHYERLRFENITNPLVVSMRIKDDGTEALVQTQFTVAKKNGDTYEFYRVCQSLLFGLKEEELLQVIAEVGMTQKQL